MKKICHITTVHKASDIRIFHKEARSLAKNGYNVNLIAATDNKDDAVENVKIIPLTKPKNRIYRILFLAKKAYKLALLEKSDIYHFHDPEFLRFAKRLKNRTGAKIIYDVHEDVPKQILSKTWIPKIFRKIISKTFNYYEKRTAKKIDFIITTTPMVKDNFIKAGVDMVQIVENMPIIDYFPDTLAEKTGKKIIYAGGITSIRGIKEIIQAIDLVPEIKLILAGKFQERGLEEKIKSFPGWNNVDFKGWLPQKETYKIMQQCLAGIVCFLPVPNHTDAIPNKIFEYMASGLPVIASNFPLWKTIVEGNNCGICVDPQNPKKIAQALNFIINNPENAKTMSDNAKKAVKEKYNWEQESKKLLDVYKQLTIVVN
jgi:glycosyltransferase involved in cell wall biosynthesis